MTVTVVGEQVVDAITEPGFGGGTCDAHDTDTAAGQFIVMTLPNEGQFTWNVWVTDEVVSGSSNR